MSEIRLSIRSEPFSLPPELKSDPGIQHWQDPAGRDCGFALHKDGRFWIQLYGCGAFVVEPGCSHVTGFVDAGVALNHFREAYFRFVLPGVLQRTAWECLHASAVLTQNGVVAFCGPSGRGKSTLARACSERGAALYADDVVPFQVRDGVPCCAQIPHRVRLRGQAASWFAEDPGAAPIADEHELLCNLEPTVRPLAALYWLQPASNGARPAAPLIEPIHPVESFRLLMGDAWCLSLDDPICNRKMIQNYFALTSRAPLFRLSFAPGREQLPAVLDRLAQHRESPLECPPGAARTGPSPTEGRHRPLTHALGSAGARTEPRP